MNLYLVLLFIVCTPLNLYATMPQTPSNLARGETLYKHGDYAKGITACITCHGPKGTGNAQAGFPNLHGQHAQYMQKQLKDFKEGKRANDLSRIMQGISAKLSQEDMEAVTHYIESLK